MIDSLKKHQFLLEELIKRDFKRKYKGAVLGMAWSVLNPLIMLLIMRLVFSHFFAADIPHYTIYLFCGTIVFTYFTEATNGGMLALISNVEIFMKVNVPKYLFLTSKNVQTFINFALTFGVFLLFCIFDGITFTWRFILLLYPIAMLLLFNIGAGLILSALYVFFRDMQYLWGLATQVLTYLSAIFYSIDSFPSRIQKLFYLNPVYPFIRYFRLVVIDGVVPAPELHILIALFSTAAMLIGTYIYRKYDTEFLYY